jgi:hypothetical protein
MWIGHCYLKAGDIGSSFCGIWNMVGVWWSRCGAGCDCDEQKGFVLKLVFGFSTSLPDGKKSEYDGIYWTLPKLLL